MVYVIDFYSGNEQSAPTPTQDHLSLSTPDPGTSHLSKVAENSNNFGSPAIYLDVRPAMSLEGAFDRARMSLKKFFEM